MLQTNQLIGFGATNSFGAPPSATFTDSQIVQTDGNTVSFTSLSFGDTDAGRRIVVYLWSVADDGTPVFDECTIGGVTAVELANLGSGVASTAIYTAAVATDADVTVTAGLSSNTGESWGLGVYRLVGYKTTAVDAETSSADPASFTMTVGAGGVMIGGAFSTGSSAWAWTGVFDGDSENYEHTDGPFRGTGAHEVFVSSQSGVNVTATGTSTGSIRLGACVGIDLA
jgi:hypothetical protein